MVKSCVYYYRMLLEGNSLLCAVLIIKLGTPIL